MILFVQSDTITNRKFFSHFIFNLTHDQALNYFFSYLAHENKLNI